MSGRRILLTGGGGFVGSHLAAGLARLGHDVTAVDPLFDAEATERLGAVRRLTAPVAGAAVDVVIHAAATTARPEECGLTLPGYLRQEIDATLAAFDLAALSDARALFISSAGVFTADAGPTMDETAAPDAIHPYACAKRAGELAASALRAAGRAVTTIRFGNIYGPDERPRPTRPRVSLPRRMMEQAAAGEPIVVATPDTRRDWLFVDDIAPAIDRLLTQAAAPAILHLCAPSAHSDLELARAVAAQRPGARLAVASPDDGPRSRPPLIGAHRGFFDSGHWTSLPAGIALAMPRHGGPSCRPKETAGT